MAFGLKRKDLQAWKEKIDRGEIAFLTHYWVDDRFPGCTTVTKVGCDDLERLAQWGKGHKLRPEWIHKRKDGYSHFDLIGDHQRIILQREGLLEMISRLEKS
ncbi:hypothetical protein J2Z40_002857 [Cytobacillus eiseniae]|uniref:YneQ n=1 Tax=Cytobacillus eiseniae TaxID=762947 RepID=A0ABS4RHC7_9BACI|nr:hypothetical protein [Cytobacillus eiseniae]MBP2242283.1 hypothetical protein [Cytobacillus eiseniae]